MVEELSCPFCGGEPDWRFLKKGCYIKCSVCGARTKQCKDEEEARAFWNTRSLPNRFKIR